MAVGTNVSSTIYARLYRYSGPGPLFVSVNPSAVVVRTGGRWRGFLSIQALRDAHIIAFVAVAHAFGADRLLCFADNDDVSDVFSDGRSVDSCATVLAKQLGEPTNFTDVVDPTIAAQTDHGCPMLWHIINASGEQTDEPERFGLSESR